MTYFCRRCSWEGEKPRAQRMVTPDERDTRFFYACPKCHGKAIEVNPRKMVYGRWYFMGAYEVKWN